MLLAYKTDVEVTESLSCLHTLQASNEEFCQDHITDF